MTNIWFQLYRWQAKRRALLLDVEGYMLTLMIITSTLFQIIGVFISVPINLSVRHNVQLVLCLVCFSPYFATLFSLCWDQLNPFLTLMIPCSVSWIIFWCRLWWLYVYLGTTSLHCSATWSAFTIKKKLFFFRPWHCTCMWSLIVHCKTRDCLNKAKVWQGRAKHVTVLCDKGWQERYNKISISTLELMSSCLTCHKFFNCVCPMSLLKIFVSWWCNNTLDDLIQGNSWQTVYSHLVSDNLTSFSCMLDVLIEHMDSRQCWLLHVFYLLI